MPLEYDVFLAKIRALKEMGFVPGLRSGDTDVGKVLEEKLGIPENNIAGPDFEVYELKSKRRESSAMMTLFTKAPQPRGVNSVLRAKFGYPPRDGVGRHNDLQVGVSFFKKNSVGLWLEYSGDRLILANERGVEAYYERDYLRRAFEKKIGARLIYVLADARRRGRQEEFHYNEAYLLSGFDFSSFVERLREGVVKFDIRLGHYADGRPHDHGTGFRVLPTGIPKCFVHSEKLL